VGVKDSYPPKKWFFIAIISCSVKKFADSTHMLLMVTSNSDKLFIRVNVDDLE